MDDMLLKALAEKLVDTQIWRPKPKSKLWLKTYETWKPTKRATH